jgi:cation diffusion facilitator CzcD-associated flavoprotein CzcO
VAGARQPRVLIIGAGFGGIAAAIELRRHGFEDVTLLEKAPELGGTWFYNRYPQCACDVPSHLYSLSFAQRRDWSRICSPRDEILRYLREVAREHGVAQLVVGETEVAACTWEEDRGRWMAMSTDGRSWEADAVILATGQLHQPAVPTLPGAERFAGQAFHSSRWPAGFDARGKRVAVIGTGASAVQFIPALARRAECLYVFQRSPNWLLPRRNRAYPAWLKRVFELVPGLQAYRRRFMYWYAETLTAMML